MQSIATGTAMTESPVLLSADSREVATGPPNRPEIGSACSAGQAGTGAFSAKRKRAWYKPAHPNV